MASRSYSNLTDYQRAELARATEERRKAKRKDRKRLRARRIYWLEFGLGEEQVRRNAKRRKQRREGIKVQ